MFIWFLLQKENPNNGQRTSVDDQGTRDDGQGTSDNVLDGQNTDSSSAQIHRAKRPCPPDCCEPPWCNPE